MLTQRTSLPYWILAPFLQGSGDLWQGVIFWAFAGCLVTVAIARTRNRSWRGSALAGAIVGGVGGAIALPLLWFVMIPLLNKQCPRCAARSAPESVVCSACGHEFPETLWHEWLIGLVTNLSRVVITIVLALIVAALILELSGKDALDTYRVLAEWGLGTDRARANSLLAATPLIFTGVATALAFRAGVFNVGVEGSLYMGALSAAWVGFTFTSWNRYPLIAAAFAVAAMAGGLWGLVPGYLKARLRVDEVVTTIMLNYIAIGFTSYMVQNGPFFVPGLANAMSETVAPQAQLPRLVENSQFNATFFIALGVVALVILLMQRSTLGYEVRVVGDNPIFARWSGIPTARTILSVMFLSGLIGGLAGAGQVLGVHYNFTARFSRGFGFDGITVALLGRNSPTGVLIGALLFGVLRSGGTTIEVFTDVPIDLVDIVQALIIFFVAIDLSSGWLGRRRQARSKPASTAAPSAS
jgi:simple sugar transport system permease protein